MTVAADRSARTVDTLRPTLLAALVVGALLGGVVLVRRGISADGLLLAGLVVLVVVLAEIDLRERRLPNRLVLPAAGIAAVVQAVAHTGRLLEFALAAVGASLFFLIPGLFMPGGVGMGDVKLAFLMGLVLGADVVLAVLVATIGGALGAIVVLSRRGAGRRTAIPYGPFLAVGTILVAVTGAGSPL